jgi:hypothetical protein
MPIDVEVRGFHELAPPVERLLPGEESVVDLQRAGADLDRAMYPPGWDPDVAVAEASIQAQGRLVVDADRKPKSIGSSFDHCAFGGRRQDRRDTASPMLRAHRHVLEFWWVAQGQVCVANRFVILPRNEVVAVALPEASQPEHGTDTFDLVRRELPDLQHGSSLLLGQDQRAGLDRRCLAGRVCVASNGSAARPTYRVSWCPGMSLNWRPASERILLEG